MKKTRKSRKLWKTLAVGSVVVVVVLTLLVVAFVFNPLEGNLREVRDVVPREVDFFLRKTDLAADFEGGLQLRRDELPRPWFWERLTSAAGWEAVEKGPLVASLKQNEAALRQARDGMVQLQEGTGGFIDLGRDLLGTEIVVAGYYQDPTKNPPQPLQNPWWCAYARVGWRLRAAWGLLQWGMVQDQVRQGGTEIHAEGEMLVIQPKGAPEPLYAARQLDCLMVANSRYLLEQSLRLIAGNESEQPFGPSSRYSGGITEPVQRYVDAAGIERANVLEFSIAPNATDSFRRYTATWPDPRNKDSMNERVLATFLNLSGWNTVSGALVFEAPERQQLSLLGQVVLNSNKHTDFQSAFYRAESQPRADWLDPFLGMVPDSACAAAALRTPVGDFLHAMFNALLPDEQQLFDDGMRRCSLNGQQLADTRDLIDKLKVAFSPRTGFVFRRNVPDPEIPVVSPSPVPQIAWLFWIRETPGSQELVQSFVDMLGNNAGVFRFKLYNYSIPGLPEPVKEFANPAIPGTGEVAMIVFRNFFVVSNSGPLIKDILRTRYAYQNARSIVSSEAYQDIKRELPQSVNGFVWLRGRNLLPVLDDYKAAVQRQNQAPDADWMRQNRAGAEQIVLRSKYPQYPTKASMSPQMQEGEFAEAVTAYLQDQWRRASAGFSKEDIAKVEQMYGMAKLIDAAYLLVDLDNNYIRFQGKLIGNY